MDIHYRVGPKNDRDGQGDPPCLLRRQEAMSLRQAEVGERIALHEAVFCVRMGLGDRLWVPDDSHLGDQVARAIVCAEILAIGKSITIGDKPVTSETEQGRLWDVAYEAARERNQLLPWGAGPSSGGPYISPGWPTKAEFAHLAHKLVYGMRYSQAQVARIIKAAGGYERPEALSRQSINRLLWESIDGEKYPTHFRYTERSGTVVRCGRQGDQFNIPFSCMAVLGAGNEAAARKYNATLDKPHNSILPFNHKDQVVDLTSLAYLINGPMWIRTLYVANPNEVFSNSVQRQVIYDLALYRGLRVIEDGASIHTINENPHYNHLLRQGTKLSTALWAHESATIMEETRSRPHARKMALRLHDQGLTLSKIATRLNEEAIPTISGNGAWGKSSVKTLLESKPSETGR